MRRRYALWTLAVLALGGCSDQASETPAEPAATPSAVFAGLPLSGNLATARAAGFGNCLDGTTGLRCQKAGVMVMGVGPLRAAVDLDVTPDQGEVRFDHVTLWHPTDQSATLPLRPLLEQQGWQSCLKPDEERFWRPPGAVRIAIDTNYWGSRRLVISAPPSDGKPYC